MSHNSVFFKAPLTEIWAAIEHLNGKNDSFYKLIMCFRPIMIRRYVERPWEKLIVRFFLEFLSLDLENLVV